MCTKFHDDKLSSFHRESAKNKLTLKFIIVFFLDILKGYNSFIQCFCETFTQRTQRE